VKFDLVILRGCESETDVQTDYKNLITHSFGNVPFRSVYTGIKHDGILDYKLIKLKILSEFKFNKYNRKKSILKRSEFAKYIVQVIYYLKEIEIRGEQIPNVIFIADEIACTIFHSDLISDYLDYKLDWTIEPSKAFSKNSELCNEIFKNNDINPKILEVEKIELKEIIDNIKNTSERLDG